MLCAGKSWPHHPVPDGMQRRKRGRRPRSVSQTGRLGSVWLTFRRSLPAGAPPGRACRKRLSRPESLLKSTASVLECQTSGSRWSTLARLRCHFQDGRSSLGCPSWASNWQSAQHLPCLDCGHKGLIWSTSAWSGCSWVSEFRCLAAWSPRAETRIQARVLMDPLM